MRDNCSSSKLIWQTSLKLFENVRKIFHEFKKQALKDQAQYALQNVQFTQSNYALCTLAIDLISYRPQSKYVLEIFNKQNRNIPLYVVRDGCFDIKVYWYGEKRMSGRKGDIKISHTISEQVRQTLFPYSDLLVSPFVPGDTFSSHALKGYKDVGYFGRNIILPDTYYSDLIQGLMQV